MAPRSTSSTRRTCDVSFRGARPRRGDRPRRRHRRVRHRRCGAARPRHAGRQPCRRPAAHHHRRSRAPSDGARRRARARRSGPAGRRRARRRGHHRPWPRGRHRPQSRQAPRNPSRSLRLRQAGLTVARRHGASLGPDDRLDQAGPRRVVLRRSQRSVPRHRSGGRVEARPAAARHARRPSPQDHVRACVGATVPGRSPAPCIRS